MKRCQHLRALLRHKHHIAHAHSAESFEINFLLDIHHHASSEDVRQIPAEFRNGFVIDGGKTDAVPGRMLELASKPTFAGYFSNPAIHFLSANA